MQVLFPRKGLRSAFEQAPRPLHKAPGKRFEACRRRVLSRRRLQTEKIAIGLEGWDSLSWAKCVLANWLEFVMILSSLVLTVLLSYLVGAIPFGYLIARWRGVDIRTQGSGNIGATNVGRVLGQPFGILVFLLDFAKGAVPVLAAQRWTATHALELPADSLPAAAGLAVFLGHLYPIYLRFRGGKGVATAAGVVSVLLPGPALAALLIWLTVVIASRYVSLASLAAAVTLCGVHFLITPQPWSGDQRSLTLFCLIAAGLIFFRHRANIARLLHGDEPRLKETSLRLHFTRILHVLALGLWFGTAIFFSFVVGFNLFKTFESVAEKAPAEREVWFPMWKVYDGPSPDPALPLPLRREQGTRAAGAALAPLFRWYFGIQAVCALLATTTALSWAKENAEHIHRLRIEVLLTALVMVAFSWQVMRAVDGFRELRDQNFDVMVHYSPPNAEDVRMAVEARQMFARWHLVSLGLNLVTVVLVTIAMAQAAYLPAIAREEQKSV
jgi:glycerol-3-phosphate acyltransferase PlsY